MKHYIIAVAGTATLKQKSQIWLMQFEVVHYDALAATREGGLLALNAMRAKYPFHCIIAESLSATQISACQPC